MEPLHNQEEHTSEDMRSSYFDHLSVDVLERFILHRSSEQEAELVETHMLACESCVNALENLELEISATKLALEQMAAERPQRTFELEPRKATIWKNWFSFATLSWAGAGLATCALCLFVFVPANIELKADRGVTSVIVPEWRNARVRFVDEGLPTGPLRAEVVNETGTVIWSGDAQDEPGAVNLRLPRMTKAGHYYARLYTAGSDHELLSEFPFEVKFQF
jgi:hypothetical protein